MGEGRNPIPWTAATRKTFFWGTVRGEERKSPGSENKPEELPQQCNLCCLSGSCLPADLTEKEHFGMSWTDLQAMAMCQTVLIQQAPLLKACTWITVEAISANTQKQQIGGNMYRTTWGGEKKAENHLALLLDSLFRRYILNCAWLQLLHSMWQGTGTHHIKRAEFHVPETEFSLSQKSSRALSRSSGAQRRPSRQFYKLPLLACKFIYIKIFLFLKPLNLYRVIQSKSSHSLFSILAAHCQKFYLTDKHTYRIAMGMEEQYGKLCLSAQAHANVFHGANTQREKSE